MLVRVEELRKHYGDTIALDGVDLAVEPGTHLLLAGANGAGKTTLLRLLTGLTGPSAGLVRIDGEDPRRSRLRQRLGLLSHETQLYDDLTVRENLRFFARLYGAPPGAADVALDGVGLAGRADTRVGVLSRGLQQRAALARATLHGPEVLLLDEPFTGLDGAASRAVAANLSERAASTDCSTVVVTHKVEQVASTTNRVVVLRQGRVALDARWSGDGMALQALCDRHLEGPP